MFHKRLLKEFNDNMKYVIGMVATQWVSLLANVGMMLTVATFVANLVMVSLGAAGDSTNSNLTKPSLALCQA